MNRSAQQLITPKVLITKQPYTVKKAFGNLSYGMLIHLLLVCGLALTFNTEGSWIMPVCSLSSAGGICVIFLLEKSEFIHAPRYFNILFLHIPAIIIQWTVLIAPVYLIIKNKSEGIIPAIILLATVFLLSILAYIVLH